MRVNRFLTALVAAGAVATFHGQPLAAIEGLETPASALRVDLDRLLSEHVFLTVQAMHAGLVDDDLFAAAAEALEANTGDLEAAIGSVYGEEGRRRFGDLWRQHIGYVVDYTRARAADDEEAEQRARDGMTAYQADFASFIAGANPNLTEEAVHHLLDDHLEQLRQVADLQSGDFEAVYDAARVSYAHMVDLGDGLSRAIVDQFPDVFSGANIAFGPALDLRIALDHLLGEHAFLAIEVMRQAGTGDGADLAASEALASNGESLESAIADIYGDEAGRAFAELWEQHNGYYIDFVRALLTGDEVAQDRAHDGLTGFSQQAADFFASASELISAEAVRSGLDAAPAPTQPHDCRGRCQATHAPTATRFMTHLSLRCL